MRYLISVFLTIFFILLQAQGVPEEEVLTDYYQSVKSINTNPQIKVQLGHSEPINSAVFSPDGKYIASGGNDNCVKLWDVKTSKEIYTLKNHSKKVTSVKFSPDGKYIASGSEDKTIVLVDVITQKVIRRFKDHDSRILSIDFSPDGTQIISGFSDGTLILFNVQNGNTIKKYFTQDTDINAVAFSPDGDSFASLSKENLKIWEKNTDIAIRTLSSEVSGRGLAYSPDGKFLASNVKGNKINIWEVSSGKEINTYEDNTSFINTISYSPNGKYLASGSSIFDNSVKVWNLETGYSASTYRFYESGVTSVAFSKDSKFLLSASEDKTIVYFNTDDISKRMTIKGQSRSIECLAISVDNKYVIAGSNDNTSKIWDIGHGKEIYVLKGHLLPVKCADFSSDGKYAATGSWDNTIRIYNMANGEHLKTLKDHTECVTSICFSPDGQLLVSGSNDKKVKIWDISTGEVKFTFDEDYYDINMVTFSSDGQYIAFCGDDRTVNVMDVYSGSRIITYKGHNNSVHSVSFTPDKSKIVSATWGELNIWDSNSGETIKTLDGNYKITLSPDGKYALLGNKTTPDLDLLDLINDSKIVTLKNCSIEANSMAISSDGKYVVLGSLDGTLNYWDVKSGQLIYSSIITADGEYLSWTPEGFFAGNEELARETVYIVNNMNIIDIDQFYELFYRPDLLQAKIEGKDISKYKVNIADLLNNNGLPPEVQFITEAGYSDKREIQLRMKVKDMGGGIGNVTLFIDGMPVAINQKGRGIKIVQKKNGNEDYNYEALITLRYGKNNIELSAYNKSNSIESRKSKIEIVYESEKVNKPDLHVFMVAVDKYRDKALWLNYSKNDADAVGKAFSDKSKKIFNKISLYKLYDNEVTKDLLSAKFTEIGKNIKPDDVFIFYLAGHGVTNDSDGDYYYLPSDFRYTGSEAIVSGGISKQIIMENLLKIKAQKLILLFDTCNSGSFIDKPASRGISEKTAIDRLKKTIGRAIIVASSESQVALEGFEDHGVFTYALIQGLLGKADFNKNDQITVGGNHNVCRK